MSGQLGILFPPSSRQSTHLGGPVPLPELLPHSRARVAPRILVSPALPRHLVPDPTSRPASKGPLSFLSVAEISALHAHTEAASPTV